MNYEIEKDIEVPPFRNGGCGRKRKYPIPDMGVGDSFFVPPDDGESPRYVQNRVGQSAAYYKKEHGGLYTTRVQGNGARCWRLE